MEQAPLTKEGAALFQQRLAAGGTDSPTLTCLPPGVPLMMLLAFPVKIVQTQRTIVVMSEADGNFRQIHLDGRPLPTDPQPSWMGYSVGHWEGATFVVETIGQNGRTWLDMRGLPGSESMKVTERYTRPTVGHMIIEVTVEDPVNYTKPITSKLDWTLLPDDELIESICEENNKDPRHMVGK